MDAEKVVGRSRESDKFTHPGRKYGTSVVSSRRSSRATSRRHLHLQNIHPPDHPLGFLMAFCAFIVQLTVLGGINSFGVFMDRFQADSDLGKPSDSSLSMIVSIANGLVPAVGCITGHISDRVGPKPVLTAAGITAGLGFFVSTECQSYMTLLLSFGLILGISGGCTISPGLAAVGDWFEERRALAYGLVYAGSGAGTTVVPMLSSYLLSREEGNNWRKSFRELAIILAVPAVLAGLVISRRTPCASSQAETHLGLKSIVTNRIVIVLFFVGMGYAWAFFSAVVYSVPYAQAFGAPPYENRAAISHDNATMLLSLFGGMSTIGSVLWGEIARRFGVKETFKIAALGTVAFMASWPFCSTFALMVVTTSGIGLFVAGCVACFPAIAAAYFAGPQLGAIIAVIFLGFGTGSMVGPPITGLIKQAQGGDYTLAFLVCAAGPLCAGLLVHFCLPPVDLVSTASPRSQRDPLNHLSFSICSDVNSRVFSDDEAFSDEDETDCEAENDTKPISTPLINEKSALLASETGAETSTVN
ncbi:Riboflavin transporter MCH5 [Diplonema papillatum]|nr:Riboflavin transporter MCH5 [Diplonema papillatum]